VRQYVGGPGHDPTTVKILVAIPHYFHPEPNLPRASSLEVNRAPRLTAFIACITGLYRQFGAWQYVLDLLPRGIRAANDDQRYDLSVRVCTTRGRHLLREASIPGELFVHRATSVEPVLLEFECHAVLREFLDHFDYYCFLEDDLVIEDPWFFAKLKWFSNRFGAHCLLQPHRYETTSFDRRKIYVDGNIPFSLTRPFQDIRRDPELRAEVFDREICFQRTRNPHASCFFLNAAQMRYWADQPHFLDRDTSFVGPIESSATLGIMKTFRVYKTAPSCANFFEIRHFNPDFTAKMADRLIRRREEARLSRFERLVKALTRRRAG